MCNLVQPRATLKGSCAPMIVVTHLENILKKLINPTKIKKITIYSNFLFTLFCTLPFLSWSQILDPYIYITGGYVPDPTITTWAIQKVDIRDHSVTSIAETVNLTDFAFHPDGRLFGCVGSWIVELDTSGFAFPANPKKIIYVGNVSNVYFTGMTIDKNGLIWLSGHNFRDRTIFTFDLNNNQLTEIGYFPWSKGYSDLEWFNGELFSIGIDTVAPKPYYKLMLTKLDLNDISKSKNQILDFNYKAWGLVTINNECESLELYATSGADLGDPGGLYKFNATLDGYTYISNPKMGLTTGATSRTSWLGSYTPLGIDTVTVASIQGNCAPPYTITAHIRKGYYMRPDIEYSLDGVVFQSDSTFIVPTPGKYVVHVRDSFGCYKMTDSIELKINSFNHQSTAVADYCGLSMGSALITAGSGELISTDGVNYVADSLCLLGLSSGVYTYYVRNASGYYDTSSLVIQDAPPFTVDLSVLADTCDRGIGTILATPSGQSGPIRLSTDGVLFESISGLSGWSSGMYSIWIKDSLGCTVHQQVHIDNVGGVEWKDIALLPPNCLADDGEIHASAEGEGLVYSLNGVSNATGLFSGLASGFYTLSIQDQNQCSLDTVIQLKGSNAPIATIEQLSPATCEMNNGSIQVVLSPDEQYSIDGIMYSADGVFTGLSEGDYTLYVINTDGCKDSTTFHITQTGSPTIDTVETSPDSCETQSGRLELLAKGIEPFTYMLNGDTINHFGTFTYLASGAYTVTVMDSLGCITARSIQIDNIGTPMTEYVVNVLPLKCGESEYIFSTQDVYIEHLTPSSDGYYHLKPGDYQITYLMYDCDNVRAVTLPAPICDPFIPNAFSPNGDGINDEFKVSGNIQVVEMRIFDRWGGCLFTSFDANTGWDGSYRDHLVQPGVYVYWIKIKLSDGSIKLFKGDVTVMR